MKCEGCDDNFSMRDLRFIPDGMVEGTTIKRRRAFCKDCGLFDTKQKEEVKSDEPEYPF